MKPLAYTVILLISCNVSSQEIRFIGRLMDSNKPVQGATIITNDSSIQTTSNSLGYFELITEPTEIIISHINYHFVKVNLEPEIPKMLVELQPHKRTLLTLILSDSLTSIDFEYDSAQREKVMNFRSSSEAPKEIVAMYPSGLREFHGYLKSCLEPYKNLIKEHETTILFTIDQTGSIHPDSISSVVDSSKIPIAACFSECPPWVPSYQNRKPIESQFIQEITHENFVHTMVEVQPEFPGGMAKFYKYVADNMNYPASARARGIQGRIYVQFVIDVDGSIMEVETIKGIGGGCDEEAERIIKSAPKFSPGRQNNVPVRVKMVMPIIFQLGNERFSRRNKTDQSLPNQLSEVQITALGIDAPTRGYEKKSISFSEAVYQRKVYTSFDELIRSEDFGQQDISIVNSQVATIPSRIKEFENLRFLDLENNFITTLPKELTELSKLEELYLPGNQLSALPESFSQLKQLRVLGLSGNRFDVFPPQILSLTKLEALDLGSNSITEIPREIALMKNLKSLILGHNQLKTLPKEIIELKKLETMYIHGNEIDKSIIDDLRNEMKTTQIIDQLD